MTVNTQNITSGPFVGNNIADQFSYTFRIEDKTQLSVFETDLTGFRTELVVDTDYTVAGIGVDAGGLITRVAGALPLNFEWFIRSNYKSTQLTAFPSQGPFFPEVHEASFDKLTFLIQQLQDARDRSFRLSDAIDIDGLFTIAQDAAARAGLFLAFDSSGDLVVSSGTGADAGLRADLAATGGSDLVGFIANDANAIATTVDDKLQEVKSLGEDFGGDGGGVVDNKTVIANAVTTAPHIFIPSGIFETTVVVPSPEKLWGLGVLSLNGQEQFDIPSIPRDAYANRRVYNVAAFDGADIAEKINAAIAYGESKRTVQTEGMALILPPNPDGGGNWMAGSTIDLSPSGLGEIGIITLLGIGNVDIQASANLTTLLQVGIQNKQNWVRIENIGLDCGIKTLTQLMLVGSLNQSIIRNIRLTQDPAGVCTNGIAQDIAQQVTGPLNGLTHCLIEGIWDSGDAVFTNALMNIKGDCLGNTIRKLRVGAHTPYGVDCDASNFIQSNKISEITTFPGAGGGTALVRLNASTAGKAIQKNTISHLFGGGDFAKGIEIPAPTGNLVANTFSNIGTDYTTSPFDVLDDGTGGLAQQNVYNGWGRNNGNPAALGAWNTVGGYEGLMVHDIAGGVNNYVFISGGWVTL